MTAGHLVWASFQNRFSNRFGDKASQIRLAGRISAAVNMTSHSPRSATISQLLAQTAELANELVSNADHAQHDAHIKRLDAIVRALTSSAASGGQGLMLADRRSVWDLCCKLWVIHGSFGDYGA